MTPLFFNNGIAPSLLFICGALLIPLLSGRLKSVYMVLLPIIALVTLFKLSNGDYWTYSFLDYQLTLGRIDGLSRIFGYIFSLISIIAVIYALRVKDNVQHVAAFMYAGGALGVTLAGDMITLYIFWELMAVASTFLILARKTRKAQAAAYRYVLVHVFGGLCLLAGIVLYIQHTGSTALGKMALGDLSTWLIFIGIAVNAAIPPMHPWLQDAYPEATVTGTIFLSAFTTKSAVYVMARTFPGTELLIYLGAFMTILPVFYAEVENDIRRVLSYSLMNQVGFMMCGIGIGTHLAINGAVSHAFCHILYKALLFMSAGAVLHVTGKIKCTDIGGLYRTMPLTCLFCIIGAASISAFPLFSGFVSKSMIISAAGNNHLAIVWLMLQFASAGVIAHAGIKVPFFTFFGHDSGIRAKEPPLNMLVAMGMAAFFCIFLGVFPQWLYGILPYQDVVYHPYTGAHVVFQLQLLLFGILAFYLLLKSGYYPSEVRATNLDTDWFYRKGARLFYTIMDRGLNGLNRLADRILAQEFTAAITRFAGEAALWMTAVLTHPFRIVMAKDRNEPPVTRQTIQRMFESGTVPLGVSAVAAALLIVGMYIMT